MSKEIPFEKSFASHEKAKYWSDKNLLKPNQVMKGTRKKYIFNCNCEHEFEIRLNDVYSKNQWCGYCANRKLCEKDDCKICFEKSFASHDKSKYWCIENNINPRQVFKNSNKKFIFDCDKCNHTLIMPLNDINSGYWCIYCANKKLCEKDHCDECFNKSFASNEKAKYWSNKNEKQPRQVFKGTNKKYIFNCNICNHEFEQYMSVICIGGFCSYCTGDKLCDNNDCEFCYNKSFASYEKAQYWSSKNKLSPRELCKKSSTNKFMFNCNICNHEFDSVLSDIYRGFWCPYCSNPPKKLCDKKDCKQCFEKSFASHEKSQYLLDKTINPINIFYYSNKKYEFNCNICNHIFISAIHNITNLNRWCPYCSNPPQKLCDKDDCKKCFEKSFASHEKVKFWSFENKELPRQIFKSSKYKYKFKCINNHNFNIILGNIVFNNSWCPYCVNKTEQKLYDNLQPIYNNLEQQYKVNWCKSDTTNKCYPFDFVLAAEKIIIELDGLQHFEQVSNWDSPDKVHERDKYKMKQANNNGFSVIRILQEDVFYDTYQWLDELKTNIEKLITENKVQNIFMCKDNEYSIFDILE